ncbi:MAG: hypothetical protein ABI895_04190 [Deltaproteobacteria bacterium]
MWAGSWSWTLAWGVTMAGVTLAVQVRADVPIGEVANRRFEEGVRYLQSKAPDRFERAYVEFKAAYADSPSWQVLGNLGMVAQELERYGEAVDAYRGYLQGGGKKLSSRERKQFQRDLLLVESDLATLTLHTNPDGAWIVDERIPDTGPPVVNRYGPLSGTLELRVRPGHHRIHAELSGYSGDTWEINQGAKTSAAHHFELRATRVPTAEAAPQPPPGPQRDEPASEDPADRVRATNGLRLASYAALGVGTAGVGAGLWFFIQQRKTSNDAERAFNNCTALRGTPDVCDVGQLNATGRLDDYAVKAQHLDGRESNQRKGAWIGFVAGGALIASGVVLFFASADSADADEEAHLVPWLSPTGIGLTGRF